MPDALDHRLLRLLLCLFALAGGAVAAPAMAAANPATISAFGSLVDLRPDRPVPSGGLATATVSVARNEARSFQVLVQGGASGNAGVRVEAAGALLGPDGQSLPASSLSLYREGYYSVTQRSNGEGEAGQWPDALIPARDSFYGEERNAFPVDLSTGAQLAVWVDVLVPEGQPSGAYTGSLVVKDAGGTIGTVPVTVNVRGFTLASTSSLQNAFFVETNKICQAFTGRSGCQSAEQAWAFDALFAEAGLDNRVTLANAYAADPTSPYFSKYFVPLVEGTDPRVQFPGAKLTSVEAYGPSCGGGSCLAAWKTAAEQHGFANRFFLYACDEPYTAADWEQCKANAEGGRRYWSGVRTLVTAPMQSSATSYVSIFDPLINEFESGAASKSASYKSFASRATGKEMWMYTSCRSYSCNATEGSEFERWPGYAIDAPPSQSVAMGWLSYLYGATGELYWSTTYSLTTATTQQYSSGGNGDGTLFYAGTPNGGNGSIAIGGSQPIPIESIRLKRIRDAREDYEYFQMMKENGEATQATEIIAGVFGPEASAAHNATVSPASIEAGRKAAAEMIESNGAVVQPEPEPAPAPAPTPIPAPLTPPVPQTIPVSAGGKSTQPAPVPISFSVSAEPTAVAGSVATPEVKVLKVEKPRSTKAVAHRGVRVLLQCTAICHVHVSAEVDPATARAFTLPSPQIAAGDVSLAAKKRAWVRLRVRAPLKKALLSSAQSSVPIKTSVTVQ